MEVLSRAVEFDSFPAINDDGKLGFTNRVQIHFRFTTSCAGLSIRMLNSRVTALFMLGMGLFMIRTLILHFSQAISTRYCVDVS